MRWHESRPWFKLHEPRQISEVGLPTPTFSEIAEYRTEAPPLRRTSAACDLIGRHGAIAPVLSQHLRSLPSHPSPTVLDVGAYDRALGKALERSGVGCKYYSVDTDDARQHDFRSLTEVSGSYDVVAMFELIEHLSYDEVDELMHAAYRLLAPGGLLMISTPNPYHPTRFFSDASHKQHWPPLDLYGFLRHVGFPRQQVWMYGVTYRGVPSLRGAPRMLLQYFREAVWRLIGLDTCGGLLAVAAKSK